jgi:ribonuclease P protein component
MRHVLRLAPQNRIKKKRDFARLQSGGGKIYSKHFLFIIGPSASRESRLGLTVTRKIDPRAVYRNRLKRRLREVFRQARPGLAAPLDIVVVARQGSGELSSRDIDAEFKTALKAHKLWKEPPSPLTPTP